MHCVLVWHNLSPFCFSFCVYWYFGILKMLGFVYLIHEFFIFRMLCFCLFMQVFFIFRMLCFAIDAHAFHFQNVGVCLLMQMFLVFRMLGCAYWFRCFSFSGCRLLAIDAGFCFVFPGCWTVPTVACVCHFQDVGLCLLVQMFFIFRMLGCAYWFRCF